MPGVVVSPVYTALEALFRATSADPLMLAANLDALRVMPITRSSLGCLLDMCATARMRAVRECALVLSRPDALLVTRDQALARVDAINEATNAAEVAIREAMKTTEEVRDGQ